MEAQDPYAFDASRCTGREDDDTKTVDPAEVGCVYTDSIEVEETQRSILIDEKVERERQGPAPRPPMPWHCEEKEEAILASDFHRSFLEALKKTKMSRGPPDETRGAGVGSDGRRRWRGSGHWIFAGRVAAPPRGATWLFRGRPLSSLSNLSHLRMRRRRGGHA